MEMAFPIFQSSGLPSVSSFGLDSATGPFRMLLTPCNAWNERRDKNHLDEWPQGSLVHPNALSPNLTGDIIQAIPLYMAVSTRLKSNNSRCSRGRCNSSSRFPRCCR
ncbi:hypothetical protein VaNZ11_013601 [Volvox africanus]|uniref:Uncharacterized protein n=1 Tax=Volvox africanus TaxID=51714 RepID=A0ABQ5SHW4_9CHLO|nr:hypothetical protein VaNZ11_013601 [Volvox africanus]